MKIIYASLTFLFSAVVCTMATEYETSFEAPDFSPGEVHQQFDWTASYGTEISLCTIVDGKGASIDVPDGEQMLQLVRPDAGSHPAAGIIFHKESAPLLNFTVEFKLAYVAHTNFGIFSFSIGSAADSDSGVQVGITYINSADDSASPRQAKIFHRVLKSYITVPLPDSEDTQDFHPTEQFVFYDFKVQVHDNGQRYDLTVKQGEEVVAKIVDQPVTISPSNYNRLIISIPGGSQGDQVFFDALKIVE